MGNAALQIMPRQLASLPNRLSVSVQQEWDRNEGYAEKAQKTAGPSGAELAIHGSGKQGEGCAEAAAHQVVGGIYAADILGVGVAEVVEHAVEEEEGANAEEAAGNDGHDPGDAGARCPAEHEHTDRNAKGADEGRR